MRVTSERISPQKQSTRVWVVLQGMGKILNEYLSSVFTLAKYMKTGKLGTVDDVLSTVRLMIAVVLNVLWRMRVDKPLGPGQIYLRTQ